MFHPLPRPGDTLAGKYVVERQLGQGGMGAVFAVSHRVTGKRLALKCLLPDFLERDDVVERFMREAKAAGRIQHRHVVDVFDVVRDGALHFIVMELLEGQSFADLLHDTSLTLGETLAILVRAMEGVAAAHSQGIIHRDLKPDNIFVCVGPSGRLDDPRVLDFGISKIADGSALTKSGAAMGTPLYMAYEQLSGQRDLDERVDVYAMGVILYEAIAGEPPHVADSPTALAIRVLTVDPVPLGQLRPDLPPGLAAVIMKALARDREHRFPTMRALIDAVTPFVSPGIHLAVPEGRGIPLRTPRSTRTLGEPSPISGPVVSRSSLPVAPTAPSGDAVTRSRRAPGAPRAKGLSPVTWALFAVALAGGVYGAWRHWLPEIAPGAKAVPLPAGQPVEPRADRQPVVPRAEQPLGHQVAATDAVTRTAAEPDTPSDALSHSAPDAAGAGAEQVGAEPPAPRAVRTVRAKAPRRKAKRLSAASSTANGAAPRAAKAQGSEASADAPPSSVEGRAGELAPGEFFGEP